MLSKSGSEERNDSDDRVSESEATDHGTMWVPSSSESEDFGDAEGADADGKWDVEIIGEEVAMNGWGRKPDVRYEAQWKNWTRADGTNVTWTNELLHEDDIKIWTRKEAERRNKLAAESTDIDVDILTNIDVHLIQSQYRQHAVEEKLKRHAAQPYVNMEEWTRQNMDLVMSDENDADKSEADESDDDERRANEHSRKNKLHRERTTTIPAAGPSRPSSSRNKYSYPTSPASSRSKPSSLNPPASSASSRTLSRASSTTVGTMAPLPAKPLLRRSVTASTSEYFPLSQSTPSPSSSLKAKGKQRAIGPSPSLTLGVEDNDVLPSRYIIKGKKRAVSPLSMLDEQLESGRVHKRLRVRRQTRDLSRRRELEQEWSAVARRTCAAPIQITNDVDDEEIPPLPEDFRYIESEYYYSNKVSDNVPRLDDEDKDMFVKCECKPSKRCTAQCSCQEPSELFINGEKALAYTRDRLFNFDAPRGVEVIECNSQCSCDKRKCPNRVAQQPRDIPIEVFKTVDRGWGVRSPMNIKRGKVLGIYTGLLIRRDVAAALSEDEKSYLFDVDGREAQDSEAEAPEDLYSVDSRAHGNWTRFINHSCDPNLIVYLVVYATIPEMNMPYIAFVATKDIPAGTEFMLDYDPIATEVYRKKKKGVKGRSTKQVIPEGRKPCSCGSGGGLCRGYV